MKRIIIALILLSTVSAKATLIHHWAFDETTGSTAFNSVSGTNGTIDTGVGFVSGGQIGNAYEFDAVSNAYVTMDDYKGILGTASRTVNIWLKTTDATDVELITWGGDGGNDGARWDMLLLGSDDKVLLNVYGGSMWSTSTVTDDIWRMFTIAWTNDGTPNIDDAMIYIDGTDDSGAWINEQGINTVADHDVMVGKNYTGWLDDPAIWDEGLSSDEVKCLYDAAQEGYNAYYFDQLKQLHDAGTGSIKLLDDWWEYASGLTGSPGLNANSLRTWLLFNEAAGTGVSIRVSGSVFRFK